MNSLAQKRALEAYRTRLARRGLARFEVIGRDADRELIRAVARRLAHDDAEAARLRAEVATAVATEAPPRRGGVFAALRRSPLIGAGLDLRRVPTVGRKVEL